VYVYGVVVTSVIFMLIHSGIIAAAGEADQVAPTSITLNWRGSFSSGNVAENTATSSVLADLVAVDANNDDAFTYTKLSDPDSKFSVVGATLVLASALDYETATSHSVTIRVTDDDDHTYDEVVTVTVTNIADGAPAYSVLPVITGTAQSGQTLSTSTGTWSGSPTYTYQWKRDGANISSATNSTYLLVSADVDTIITVTVTATNGFGTANATADGVGPIGAVPANSVLPAISGTTQSGQTLSTTTGTWSGSPTYTYQWKRDGANISGATNANYLLTVTDVSTTITVTVTATNGVGSASATASGVGPITAASSSLAITGTPPTSATIGSSYTFTPVLSGGTAPYTVALANGSLPSGLSLNTSTGVISGTPTVAGTSSSLVLRVTDALSATSDLAAFTLIVGSIGYSCFNTRDPLTT